jgi:hypothetical protein
VNLSEFLTAASDAWSLLASYPFRWLAIVVVFLVAVESLMFIPYVGFLVKLAVAGIVVPQVVAIFAGAAQGQAPNLISMLGAFSLPPSTQAVLVGAALFPFALGILFLYAKGGTQAIEFFFGNILKTKPPSAALFEQFKYVMQLMALPFTLLAGAVVVKGLVGLAALSAALSAAIANWLPVLLLAILALAFEWSSAQLPSVLPKPMAVAIGGLLLVVFLAWSFAITYTVSAKVFGPPSSESAA